jgi:hypothetical protein
LGRKGNNKNDARTGLNDRLFSSGGLKELFEDGGLVKVLHAATGDCLGFYRAGVQLWNLYDTALAHKVIQYQNLGIGVIERFGWREPDEFFYSYTTL